jgi:hypothetical protein
MLPRPRPRALLTALLLAAAATGCQSTRLMHGQPHAALTQAPPPARENLAYADGVQSPYHVLDVTRGASVARAAVVPAAALIRGQNPEALPPASLGPLPEVTAASAPVAAGDYACKGSEKLSAWQRCKRNWQACWIGFPEEWRAPPLGASVYLNGKTMVANGEAARMVLYHYDFEEGGVRLNQRGHDQLAKIACMLPANFFPVVIERTPELPGLAQARRMSVLQELAQGSFPVPPERVVVGEPAVPGLRGVEAEVIYRNLLLQTRTSGTPLSLSQDVGGVTQFLPTVTPTVP